MESEEKFLMKHPSGRRITYKVVGDASGRPVVYFHGWGSAASSVFFERNFLKQHDLFIILVNRPGYGGSKLVKDYSMADYADDVKDVLDHLNIERACFMAWSNGGLFCQVFAYHYPQYISSLSLAASAVPLNNKESGSVLPLRWKILMKLNRIAPFLNRKYATRVNRQWTGHIGRHILRIYHNSKQEGGAAQMKSQLKKQTTAGMWDAYRTKGWAEYFELNAIMKSFKARKWKPPFPVYIWSGEKDNLWPVETSRFLQKKFEGSQLQIVKKGGHFFFLNCWKDILKKAITIE